MAMIKVVEDWAVVTIVRDEDEEAGDGSITYSYVCSCGVSSSSLDPDYIYGTTEDVIADAEVHLEHRCSLRP